MHFMYKKHGSARKTAAPAIFLLAAVLLCFLVGAGLPASAAAMPEQSIHDAVHAENLIWAEEPSIQLNLGVTFRANMAGSVSKVRIYARADESGSHTVQIWDAQTRTVAAGPYDWNVTAPGTDQWLTYTLPEAFPVTAGSSYAVTVSNSAEFQFYPCYEGFFAAPVSAPAFGVDINSGCFGVGAEAYPQNAGINGRSFLRDIVFVPDGIYNPDSNEGNGSDEKTIHGIVQAAQVTFAEETVPLLLGTAFSVKTPGTVTKVKAYTAAGESGSHLVSLYDADENRIISGPHDWDVQAGTFGWQTYTLPEAVRLEAGKRYVVSVSSYGRQNGFPLVENYFAQAGGDDTFVTYENGGVFTTDLDALPANASARSFLRDIVFIPDASAPTAPETNTETGDPSDLPLFALLLLLAGAAAVLTAAAGRKETCHVKKNIRSFCIISITLSLLLAAAYGAAPVKAANVAKGEAVSIHGAVPADEIAWAEETVVLNPGTKFAVKVPGEITKIRLYTSKEESGPHTVALWDAQEKAVIAGPYEWNITAGTEGWREFSLPQSVSVEAGRYYVATVSTHAGFLRFPFTNQYFGVPDSSDIFTVYSASGVFGVGADTFPENTYDGRTYYRDVVFVPSEDFSAGAAGTDPDTDPEKGAATLHGALKGVSIYSAEETVCLSMGTRFAVKRPGTITKVKLYTAMEEGAADRQVVIFDAYDGSEAAGPFEWTTAANVEGWQYFTLPEALKIEAYHDYIVMVTTDTEKPRYSLVESYFTPDRLNGELFITYPDGGVFGVSDDYILPEQTYNQRTFLRDVVFIPEEAAAAPVQDAALAQAESLYLSDLKPGYSYSFNRPVYMDSAGAYEDIYISGKRYQKGLSMYACPYEGGAFAEYNIEGLDMKTFLADVGITEELGIDSSTGTVQFIVFLDGVEIAKSDILAYGETARLTAEIMGGKILRLAVNDGGDGNTGDLAAYGNAALSKLTDPEAILESLAHAAPAATKSPEADETAAPPASQRPAPTDNPDTAKEQTDSTALTISLVIGGLVIAAAVTAVVRIVKKRKTAR